MGLCRTLQEEQTSRPLALSLSSARTGIDGVPSGPGSGYKAIPESTGDVRRQRLSTERVGMSPWLSTFCFRRWHSKQDVAERPLFGFSTGLLPLILKPSIKVVMESVKCFERLRENPPPGFGF